MSSVGGSTSSGMPSGDDMRAALVTKFNGDVGDSPKEEPLDTLLDAAVESAELKLEDRPWLMTRSAVSLLVLGGATMAFADCPRPPVCGRGSGWGLMERAPLSGEVFDVGCFEGDVGRDGGDSVVDPARRGLAMRGAVDTVEPGLDGRNCGEA